MTIPAADGVSRWAVCRARLRRDAERLRAFQDSKFGYKPLTWFLDPAWAAVLFHRLSVLAWTSGRRKLARVLMQLGSLLTGADLPPTSDLGPGLLIPSPCGVVLSGNAGADLTVMALAGFGQARDNEAGADVAPGSGLPILGANVLAGPFSGVLGGARIGDGTVLQPGALARRDVAAGSVLGVAARPRQVDWAAPVGAPAPLAPCGHASWDRCRTDLRADAARYANEVSTFPTQGRGILRRLSAGLMNPLVALSIHRRSHWHQVNGRVRLARGLSRLNIFLFRLTIPPQTCLGPGVLMPHPAGVVLCGSAGANLSLYADVVCAPYGDVSAAPLQASPQLGDGVALGGHAGVFGPVRIGNHARLAPKVQAIQDVPTGAVALAAVTRIAADHHGHASSPSDQDAPARGPWREARSRMREDDLRLSGAGIGRTWYPGRASTRLHRLSRCFFVSGRRRLARWCWLANVYLTGADISPASDIGGGLSIPHPAGVSLHVRAGEGLFVGPQAGAGPAGVEGDRLPDLAHGPRLGAGVRLEGHCGVYGPAQVGDEARLLPGCFLSADVPAGATLAPPPPRLRRRPAT